MPQKQSKREVRAAVIDRRRGMSISRRQGDTQALLMHLPQIAQTNAAGDPATAITVCAYVPIGTEPGSPQMLDRLVELGFRVLLPVTHADEPLGWGDYRANTLVDAEFGLREPARPHLPPATIALAQAILVPALAVDRRGVRLGRGAGFYDRSLPLAAPDAARIAVVYDEDLVDQLPTEAHDVPMTHAFTPGLGLIELGS